MITKKLFKGTERELLITEKNGVINVFTKKDLELKQLKKQELRCFYESVFFMFLSFLLGCCVTYLMMK